MLDLCKESQKQNHAKKLKSSIDKTKITGTFAQFFFEKNYCKNLVFSIDVWICSMTDMDVGTSHRTCVPLAASAKGNHAGQTSRVATKQSVSPSYVEET